MKEKNTYVILEFSLTLLLVLAVTILLGELLTGFWKYLILAYLSGFVFSWFNRVKKEITVIIICIGAVLTFAWIGHALYNSNFTYKEIVSIAVKGGLILGAILSFDALSPILSYIQALSIPLFMGSALFVKAYDGPVNIIVLAYFMSWLAILKIKFYRSQELAGEEFSKRLYAAILTAVSFIVILFFAWILFFHFPLAEIKKGGLFFEENEYEDKTSDVLEKEYYQLQNKIQDKVTALVPQISNQEQRYEVIGLLSSLIKELPDTIEVDKAMQGLIDYLHRPGPGLEDQEIKDEIITLINQYMNKKVAFNLKRTEDKIGEDLKQAQFNLKDRFQISSKMNQLEQSTTYQKTDKYGKELKNSIENSSTDRSAKKGLKESAGLLKEWQAYRLYRQKMQAMDKKIASMEKELKADFSGLSARIKAMDNLDDAKDTYKGIQKLQDSNYSGSRDLIKGAKEIANLKLDMLASAEKKKLGEKIEGKNLPEQGLRQIGEALDAVNESENAGEFMQNYSQFKEKLQENGLSVPEEADKFLELKLYLGGKEKKDEVEELLKKNVPDNFKKPISDGLDNMEVQRNLKNLSDESARIKENLEKLFNRGLLPESVMNEMSKKIDEFGDFSAARLKSGQEAERDSGANKQQQNYQEELEDSLENSLLDNSTKQAFEELAKQLSQAQNLPELKNIDEAVSKEIETLSKEELSQKEEFVSGLKKEIEDLSKINPEAAKKLEAHLEDIKNSRTSDEFKDKLNQLKERVNSQMSELKEALPELKNIDEAVSKEIESLSKEELSQKEEFVSGLKKEIEDLSKINPEAAKKLEAHLEDIKNSRTSDEFKDKLNQLKERVNSQMSELKEALPELKNIDEAVSKEIETLSREESNQKEAGKLKESFDKALRLKKMFLIEGALAGLRKEIEDLSKINPEAAKKLEAHLEDIKNSRTSDELEKNLKELKEYLKSQEQEEQEESTAEQDSQLQLYILPSRAVVPPGRLLPLKIFIVYNGAFLKEINSDLEWSSPKPQVAWVDEQGFLHSVSEGKVDISVKYKGSAFQRLGVEVVKEIPQDLDKTIKAELGVGAGY